MSVSTFLSALLEPGHLSLVLEKGGIRFWKFDRLIVDSQEYTCDYDNAGPALARKYDIGQGSETIEYT